ncbi:MAG TPA: YgiQ family radical SAM protein, partial [Spirochaetota bacterium]
LAQKHGDRYLIQNLPSLPLSTDELDEAHNLEFERDAHPFHAAEGEVRALETIRFSTTTHRGCYGECNFCAITVHQGRTVVSRSEESIIHEVSEIIRHPRFKGIIHDLGGPTANMYGYECEKKLSAGGCRNKRCLYPTVCRSLKVRHTRQRALLKRVMDLPGVKKVFVASGVRYDLIFADPDGEGYLEELVMRHVSGQMKVAPEHTSGKILGLMGKPPRTLLLRFKKLFESLNEKCGKRQFLTYYFIAAHPGSTIDDMRSLASFSRGELKHRPEQVQIFTPTPSTFSTLMYYTGRDPFSGESIFVERDYAGRSAQKEAVRGAHQHHGGFHRKR